MQTFAMRLVGVGSLAIVGVLTVFLTQPFAAGFTVILAVFIGAFAAIGLASVLWSGAQTRRWFWLVALAPGVVILLFNGPYAPYALSHPADVLSFGTTLLSLIAAAIVIVGSLVAWREVGRGRALWEPRGRAGLVIASVAGLLLGALLTSVAAASSTSVGIALSGPPAATAILTARDTKFLETVLDARSGEVLGIFVTNEDVYAHSFHVDALGIHVALPAGSTTFVALRPAAAGRLEFYCAVPGHRDAGMVGTIDVR
jgi:hypothetical protein